MKKDTIKVSVGSTKMVAHRGVSGLETENTAAAFVAAGNRSYYGIETDIHVTTDGKFLCQHDGNANRTSGIVFELEQNTAESARFIVHRDKHGTDGRRDLVVPTLSDYITICRDYGKESVLEIKSNLTEEQLAAMVAEIRELGHFEGTTFIAFGFENLVRLRAVAPDAKAQFLCCEIKDETVAKLVEHKLNLDVLHTAITSKEQVDALHAKGIEINVWTVDSKERCEELASFGIDYITSNICE